MKAFFAKFPCIINGTSLALTTVASSTVFFHVIEGGLGLLILVSSAVTSLFTCLIAIRRWYRGVKLEKLAEEEK